MVVDAVLCLDQSDLDESLIGIKKVPGGGMQDSMLIRGVAFKKTFTYAGAEQQPKSFKDPLILSLNVELELKAEKDNAEVRVEAVSEYQAIVARRKEKARQEKLYDDIIVLRRDLDMVISELRHLKEKHGL